MEGVMRRIGFVLLAICAMLAVGSAAGGLARAASRTVAERIEPLQPVESPTPSFWVYLPMVVRESGVGSWTTIVEEGFETEPSSLWTFEDFDGSDYGTYYWARRTCRPQTDSDPINQYSAWAVGGGADGVNLSCLSPNPDNYPDNAYSWMKYGPFSLKDATAATLSFKLWMHVDDALYDTLYILTSLNADATDGGDWGGVFMTYQPAGWATLTFNLDDLMPPDIVATGQEKIWIALVFISDDAVSYPEGVYVDDFVIRKCTGGLCQSAAGAGAQLSAAQMRRVQRVKLGEERRLQMDRRLLR
jgi:hypothetical protein